MTNLHRPNLQMNKWEKFHKPSLYKNVDMSLGKM